MLRLKATTGVADMALLIKTIQWANGVAITISSEDKSGITGAKIAARKPNTVMGAITGATKTFAGTVTSES